MRFVLLTLAFAGCASTSPAAPGDQSAVERAFADVVAAASAPETDAETFTPLVAYQGGDLSRAWRSPVAPAEPSERAQAETLLAELRTIIDDAREADGRFVYEIAEYVHEPTDVADWHVLRLTLGDASGDRTTEVEAAFVPGPDGFLLGRLAY